MSVGTDGRLADRHVFVANGCRCHVACLYCEVSVSRAYAPQLSSSCGGKLYHESGAHKADIAGVEGYVTINGHDYDFERVDVKTEDE